MQQIAEEGANGLLAKAFDALSDAILVLDHNGRILRANRAAGALIGRAPAELSTLTCDALLPDLEFPQVGTTELTTERAGRPIALEVTANRSVDAPDAIYTLVLRDVGHRRVIERLQDQFISAVSHELRTPLTSIRGALALLGSGVLGSLSPEARDLVKMGHRNTERLVALVNDILDLERLEGGRVELVLDQLDAANLLEPVVESLRAQATQKQVRVKVRLGTGSMVIRGDRERLSQALKNLLHNAIKWSPDGGLVEIRLRAADGHVEVSVVDQGPGISRRAQARLFDRFQQADASDTRAKGGVGLGLAISRAIVLQHGGSIGVESERGGGARFYFRLPDPTALVKTGSGLGILKPDSDYDLLLVEEDPIQARALRLILEDDGYAVRWVADIEKARYALALTHPRCVVLDPELGGGAGANLLNDVAQASGERPTPVVVLTRMAPTPSLREAPGVVEWLQKPVDYPGLSRQIRRAVRPPGPPRVLAIDDDPGTRQLIREELKGLGFECVTADEAEQGAALARSFRPDLLILDVGLPGADGFDLVSAFRKGELRRLPLLVYTARDLSEADRQRLRLGPTRHLTNCRVTESEFVEAVQGLLAGVSDSLACP